MNRRDFIKNMVATVGSASPLLKMGGGLGLLSSATMASSVPTDGFKALVIVNLNGGSDSMNTFIPTAEDTHAQYKEIRTTLGIEREDLSKSEFYKTDNKGHYVVEMGDANGDKQPYWPDDGYTLGTESNKDGQYRLGSYHTKDPDGNSTGLGIHAFMPELAALYDNKKLSIVSGVGILVEPTFNKDGKIPGAKHPPFLFSHSHQSKAVSSLTWKALDRTGWAGRLADKWSAGGKINGDIGLNLSFTGGGNIFHGIRTSGLNLTSSGLKKYPIGNDYINKVYETVHEENNFNRVYNKKLSQQARFIDFVNDTWQLAPDFDTFDTKNAYGKNLFDTGGESFEFRQLLGMRTHHGLSAGIYNSFRDTAKMLKLSRDTFNNNRQVFYIDQGGYDYHGGQLEVQTKHLRTMSMAVSDFYKALEEMGMEKEVLVIQTSDFGRTMMSNNDGTDHGWGGHGFMLCGDPKFNGGNVFGRVMEDVSLSGPYAVTNRARILPSTAMEQMMAPALKWFGVDEATMAHVLPNLYKFKPGKDTDDIETAFLQGVFKDS